MDFPVTAGIFLGNGKTIFKKPKEVGPRCPSPDGDGMVGVRFSVESRNGRIK